MPEEEKPQTPPESPAEPQAKAKEEPKAEEKKPVEPPKSVRIKKRRKINRMKLPEMEAELKALEEKKGGLRSDFARHLAARKKELTVK